MVWSAPMTAVANTIFTAAQFNTFVRDNLNETAPAKATTEGEFFTATGTNTIVARRPNANFINTVESTTSLVYTDLASVGPSVTVSTGSRVLVMIQAGLQSDAANAAVFASVSVSGASSVAANDNWAVVLDGVAANNALRFGSAHMFTSLTPGINTFVMKYRVGSNTGTFEKRDLVVVPF